MRLQPVSDPAGDTSISLILFLPDVDTTRQALAAMQAEGVPAGGIYDHKVKDWHIYAYWEHILGRKAVARDGLPWTGVARKDLPRYSKTMCPQTLDYLGRAVMLELNWQFSRRDCDALAAGINKVLARM